MITGVFGTYSHHLVMSWRESRIHRSEKSKSRWK